MTRQIRIVFMGTPEFALPTLEALIGSYNVVGVVTQPDRPAGRGRVLRLPPVKEVAIAHQIPVFQTRTLRRPKAVERLESWTPDAIVTAATGHILTPEILALPTHGTLNVHASLLPRWRGAAPIQAAILAGDTETGVTIMCTDEGLDTGPILCQRSLPIAPRETAASLHDKLAQMGADLLLDCLPRWISGGLTPVPQASSGVTVAPTIHKEDGLIHWSRPAHEIDRQVRAYTPWPGTFTFWGEQRLKVIETYPERCTPSRENAEPGTVILVEDLPAIVTGAGVLALVKLQLAGKRPLSGVEFIRGRSDFIGARLGAA